MICPKCEGEVWDNRERIRAEGWKGPQFKCKDEHCGWLQWPPKAVKKVAEGGPGMPAQQVPRTSGPKHTWPGLSDTYYRSLLIARKQVVAMGAALKLEVRIEDILSAAATIFIAASRDGVKLPEPEPEPQEAEV
jgi:hypothetical protein